MAAQMLWLALATTLTIDHTSSPQSRVTGARDAALGAPAAIVEIDTGRMRGDPAMLAWSPYGKTLYLQMVERDRKGAVTSTTHFLIDAAEETTKGVVGQPAWVGP